MQLPLSTAIALPIQTRPAKNVNSADSTAYPIRSFRPRSYPPECLRCRVLLLPCLRRILTFHPVGASWLDGGCPRLVAFVPHRLLAAPAVLLACWRHLQELRGDRPEGEGSSRFYSFPSPLVLNATRILKEASIFSLLYTSFKEFQIVLKYKTILGILSSYLKNNVKFV